MQLASTFLLTKGKQSSQGLAVTSKDRKDSGFLSGVYFWQSKSSYFCIKS